MTKRFTTGMAQIDPRFVLWRKIRLPLALGIITVLLIISALVLYFYVVARSIRHDLARAAELAATDTVESHQEALDLLEGLVQEHGDHEEVRTRYAWQLVLMALRFGADGQRLAEARQALAQTEGLASTPLLAAARAGMVLVEGDAARTLQLLGPRPGSREGTYVKALALARRGQDAQAVDQLDEARKGVPPFAPALNELALMLRQQGRFDEAQAALTVLARTSAGHQDAVVQGVLLALDRGEGSAGLAALVPELTKNLGAVTFDEGHPRSRAYRDFAAGRIALLKGEVAEAEGALARAAKVLDTNQAVARWLATARHAAGQHEEALEALAAFPDEPATDLALLRTRLEILLALHRTADAQKSLTALTKRGAPDLTLAQGRLLFSRGDLEASVGPLRDALKQGRLEAGFLLADALVRLGKAEEARAALSGIKGEGPEAGCAAGYRAFLDGKTRQAREALLGASKAGGRCGPELLGLLLISAGGTEGQDTALAKALAEREDVRDRVILGRMKLRTEGNAAARAELDKVKAFGPQGAIVLRELALAYLELGQADQARAVAIEGVKTSGGHPLVVSVAARLAREAKQLEEASKLLEDGLKTNPRSTQLLLERAALQSEQNRFADAAASVEDALQQGETYGAAICLRAEIQQRRGERETAQVDLNRALLPAHRHSGASAELEIRECLVDFHLKRGPSSLGRAKTALFFMRQQPFEDAQIEFLSGQLDERENRLETAAGRYRTALKLDPAHLDSWRRLARMKLLGDADKRLVEKIWPGVSLEGR